MHVSHCDGHIIVVDISRQSSGDRRLLQWAYHIKIQSNPFNKSFPMRWIEPLGVRVLFCRLLPSPGTPGQSPAFLLGTYLDWQEPDILLRRFSDALKCKQVICKPTYAYAQSHSELSVFLEPGQTTTATQATCQEPIAADLQTSCPRQHGVCALWRALK